MGDLMPGPKDAGTGHSAQRATKAVTQPAPNCRTRLNPQGQTTVYCEFIVGIARALYRDPPVLFMDETTSALDQQTENAVNEVINSLSSEKTILVIAHRQTSLRYCEKIIDLSAEHAQG